MLTAKIATVFGLAAVELWGAIPAGLALGLHPMLTGAIAALGAIVGTVVVLIVGERIRTLLLRFHSGRGGKPQGSAHRIWLRYGVTGLGLLAPLLIGAPLGTALGVALGAPRRRLLLWMSIGIVLWSAGLTLAFALGIAGIQTLTH
ncbi:MAG: small multi-drug export protein [Chloroflexota bacterium]|nr:small multi-drug export protein [Chloroflexota bacterium]